MPASCFSSTAATNQDHVCFFQFHARYLSVSVLLLVPVPHLPICLPLLFLVPIPCMLTSRLIPVSYSSPRLSTNLSGPFLFLILIPRLSTAHLPGPFLLFLVLVLRLSNALLAGPFLFLVIVPRLSTALLAGHSCFLSSSTPVHCPPGWSIPVSCLVPRLSNAHLSGPFLFLILVPRLSTGHLAGPFLFLILVHACPLAPVWSIPFSYSSSTPVHWPPGWSIPVSYSSPRLSTGTWLVHSCFLF
jgi:hypothetical protein